jgi:hypothetical protein
MELKIFFASLNSLKKEVGSRVGSGSGSISQRYGSAEPDPHQKVTNFPTLSGSNRRSTTLSGRTGTEKKFKEKTWA